MMTPLQQRIPLVLNYILLIITLATKALSTTTTTQRSILITGANKGQGYALCDRILAEHSDTHVFLCSRDVKRGEDAARALLEKYPSDRVDVIPLDVTSDDSVSTAHEFVVANLAAHPYRTLFGVVSNAGILWGYTLQELLNVCTVGVRRVLDAFCPLVDCGGRVIVVSSGLGPLMHGYSSEARQEMLLNTDCTYEDIQGMMDECLALADDNDPTQFEEIGFSGGPFAESAPDFHMYGLAKMFADAYMLSLARHQYPDLHVVSCDPGLVYTDLIGRMPRYQGKVREDTTAQTPQEGVEAAMRLLFDENHGPPESGRFYAMSKDGKELLHSEISKMPNK